MRNEQHKQTEKGVEKGGGNLRVPKKEKCECRKKSRRMDNTRGIRGR
jgi:hypothetical protein